MIVLNKWSSYACKLSEPAGIEAFEEEPPRVTEDLRLENQYVLQRRFYSFHLKTPSRVAIRADIHRKCFWRALLRHVPDLHP